MRILVTGGSGFLGRRVLDVLASRGHDVRALARSRRAAEEVEARGASAVHGDLDDPASLDKAFVVAEAEALLNVASLGFGHAPAIVAAAQEARIGRAVFISTTAITTTLPARSKQVRAAAEETVRGSALEWTILRPTMIYGEPGDRNVERLLRLLRRVPILPVPGGGHRLQQPVHVSDLAETTVNAIEREKSGATYDVPGPDPMSLRMLIAQAAAAVGRRVVIIPVPLSPAIWAVRAYEQRASRPRLKAEQLERLAEDKAFDPGPAMRDLAHAPRSFAEGVAREAELLA